MPVKQGQDSRGVDESWLDFTLQTNKNSRSNLNQLKVDESTRDSMTVCSQMQARIATVINPRAKPHSRLTVLSISAYQCQWESVKQCFLEPLATNIVHNGFRIK